MLISMEREATGYETVNSKNVLFKNISVVWMYLWQCTSAHIGVQTQV